MVKYFVLLLYYMYVDEEFYFLLFKYESPKLSFIILYFMLSSGIAFTKYKWVILWKYLHTNGLIKSRLSRAEPQTLESQWVGVKFTLHFRLFVSSRLTNICKPSVFFIASCTISEFRSSSFKHDKAIMVAVWFPVWNVKVCTNVPTTSIWPIYIS